MAATVTSGFRRVATGAKVDFLNDTGSDISSGDLIQVGALAGWAVRDTPDGKTGAMELIKPSPIYEYTCGTVMAADAAVGALLNFSTDTFVAGNADSVFVAVPGAGGREVDGSESFGGLDAADGAAAAGATLIRVIMRDPPGV